ncbi:extracellular solute-binding protein [Paenibacillus cymbidii]|uniref:extracellular solute-binding protein n=1 Tax=Paenibacillus cymbidii TaxID=1639034 RepID=UPI001081019A|nr:extracellular solute-binding protein [Paenibacillus cymbidii]
MSFLMSYPKKRFSFLTLAVMIAILVVSAGCSSKSSKDPVASPAASGASPTAASVASATPKEDPKLTLTLWTTQTGTLSGQKAGEWVEQDLAKEWNEIHPNVKIKVEIIPFDGINEKITTAIASKSAPDLLFDVPSRTLAYGQMGALATLDDIIPKEDLDKIHNNPGIMKMVTVNGKVVTMPYSSNPLALIVDKSIWKDANAEKLLPSNEFRTWTPEQFKAALKAVVNKDKGIYGASMFALNEQGDSLYNSLFTSYGATLFNDDYSKYVAADSPQAEQALSMIKSLVDEGLVNPHPESISAVNIVDFWKQRKTGMILGGPTHADIIKSGLKDGSVVGPHEYMYVSFPSPTEGKSALNMQIGYGTVFKNGDANKEKWAKDFLYWSQTKSKTYANAMKVFNPFSNEAPEWTKDDPEMQFLAKLATKAKDWPVLDPGYGIKGYPEMRAAMFPEMQKMFINQSTPKQTIDTISKKFNDIITKYKK